eukprot:3935046-Rhodomonas_salina.2
MSCESPPPDDILNTGRCCRIRCFTDDTCSVATWFEEDNADPRQCDAETEDLCWCVWRQGMCGDV